MLGGALGPGHKAVLLFLGKISSEGDDQSVGFLLSRQHMSSRVHRSGGGFERERSIFSWADKGPFHKTKHPLGSREGIRLWSPPSLRHTGGPVCLRTRKGFFPITSHTPTNLFTVISRAQASYPCGNFSDTSFFKLRNKEDR